jgi:hypothetical protein
MSLPRKKEDVSIIGELYRKTTNVNEKVLWACKSKTIAKE